MIYGFGDSCTFEDYELKYKHIKPYPKWPEILGNKLNLQSKNFGKPGIGNQQIKDLFIDSLVDFPKPKVAGFLLSDWQRVKILDFPANSTRFKLFKGCAVKKDVCEECELLGYLKCGLSHYFENNILKTKLVSIDELVYQLLLNNLRTIYQIQEFCRLNNVEYIIVQGLNPIGFQACLEDYVDDIKLVKKLLIQSFIQENYLQKLDKSKIYGFPFLKEIGGYDVYDSFKEEDEIGEIDPRGTAFNDYNKVDSHPSKLGQEKIANIFYELYKKNYRD